MYMATAFGKLADSRFCQRFDNRLVCGLALFLGIISATSGITLYTVLQAEARPFAPNTPANAVRMPKSTAVVVGNDALNYLSALASITPHNAVSFRPEEPGQMAGVSATPGNGVRQRVSTRMASNDFCGPPPPPGFEGGNRAVNISRATMTLSNGKLTTTPDYGAGYNVSPLLQGGSFGSRFALPLAPAAPAGTFSSLSRQDEGIEGQGLFPAFGQCHLPQDFATSSILTFGSRFDFFSSFQTNHARAAKYSATIKHYSAKYGLPVSLVKGIMQAESNFNPFAVSHQQALGLMQVVPATAGGEVYAYLTGFRGQPSADLLLQPETNIQYGTTYLHLLSSRYFHGVFNKTSRELCVIAAYNGGPGAVIRLFGTETEDAAIAINALTPEEVYTTLTSKMPSQETRQYVSIVLGHARNYSLSQE